MISDKLLGQKMYENKNNWARKVGFGFRPDDEVP